jgi:predicted MFS family arabinose efflux permease
MKRMLTQQHAALSGAFRRLVWSNLAAQSAEQVGLAATPLVAVFALGASAAQSGYLQTAQTLPFLCLSVPLGVLADRASRQRLMTVAETLRALTLVALLAALMLHLLTLPLLAVFGFIGAAGTVAYNVAAPSLVASLVPRENLPAANGRIELARSVAYSAGPAIGGLLVGWIGPAWAFGAAAALSTSAVALLAGLREPTRVSAGRRHFGNELREGARFAANDPLLRPIMLTAVFFNIGLFTIQAIYVPYAAHRLGLSPAAVGVTLAAYGVGMVLGALAAPTIAKAITFGSMIAIGPVCGLAAAVTMAMTLVVPSFWLAFASFFLLGSGPILWVVSSTTLRQAITPASMLGRVSALINTATYGARPVGALIGATVAQAQGPGACLLVAVVAFAIQAGIIMRSPAARLVQIPDLHRDPPQEGVLR